MRQSILIIRVVTKLSIIAALCVIVPLSSCGGMSRKDRIEEINGLKNIKSLALVNFAVAKEYSVGSGEDLEIEVNLKSVKAFGRLHLQQIYSAIKEKNPSLFLDLIDMLQSDNYKKLGLGSTYSRKGKFYGFLAFRHFRRQDFISPIDGLGVVDLTSENAGHFCKILEVDGVLSIEVGYNLDSGMNIPLNKPEWVAKSKIIAKLFDSNGILVWKYDFKAESPVKIKAAKSTNIIIYSGSSINGEQITELIESVAKYSSQKLVESLYGDLVAIRQES